MSRRDVPAASNQPLDYSERDALCAFFAQQRSDELREVTQLPLATDATPLGLLEVDNSDARRRAEQDVLQLEVAVGDADAVQLADLLEQLARNRAVLCVARPVRGPSAILVPRRDDAVAHRRLERLDESNGPRTEPRVYVRLHGGPLILLPVPLAVAVQVRDELRDAGHAAHADGARVPPSFGYRFR